MVTSGIVWEQCVLGDIGEDIFDRTKFAENNGCQVIYILQIYAKKQEPILAIISAWFKSSPA